MAITKNEDTGLFLFGFFLCALGGIHVLFGRIETKGSVYRVETEPFTFWFLIGVLMIPGALCALIGLVMTIARRRREGVRLSSKARIGLVLASALGLALAYVISDESIREKKALEKRVGALSLGMTQAEFQSRNAEPDLICPQNRKVSLWSPGHGKQGTIWTAQTWVFRVRESGSTRCGPSYEDTEIGWGQDGAILWYTRHSGATETVLVRAQERAKSHLNREEP